jgi:hypothetical protein
MGWQWNTRDTMAASRAIMCGWWILAIPLAQIHLKLIEAHSVYQVSLDTIDITFVVRRARNAFLQRRLGFRADAAVHSRHFLGLLHVIQKFRGRVDARYQQMIPRASAGDVKEVTLGVMNLLRIGVVADGLDACLQRDYLVVAGHHYYSSELKPFSEVHGADRDLTADGFDVFIENLVGYAPCYPYLGLLVQSVVGNSCAPKPHREHEIMLANTFRQSGPDWCCFEGRQFDLSLPIPVVGTKSAGHHPERYRLIPSIVLRSAAFLST